MLEGRRNKDCTRERRRESFGEKVAPDELLEGGVCFILVYLFESISSPGYLACNRDSEVEYLILGSGSHM